MAGTTSIEWTATVNADGTVTPGKTWNPTRGCSRVSEGCRQCYAETLAGRYSAFGAKPDSAFAGFVTKVNGHASWTGKVELVESMLDAPLHWKKPCRIFVNSMSDLFHEALPHSARVKVFNVMQEAPQHTYQILTKRAKIMREFGEWWCMQHVESRMPANWWFGVSTEDEPTAQERIPELMKTPSAVRFVSYEPALGPINFENFLSRDWRDGTPQELPKLHWLIAGFESGPGARTADEAWIRSAKNQCVDAGVAFFYKQRAVGGRKISTPELDGQKWVQFPEVPR